VIVLERYIKLDIAQGETHNGLRKGGDQSGTQEENRQDRLHCVEREMRFAM
jgi:hypothetical protein